MPTCHSWFWVAVLGMCVLFGDGSNGHQRVSSNPNTCRIGPCFGSSLNLMPNWTKLVTRVAIASRALRKEFVNDDTYDFSPNRRPSAYALVAPLCNPHAASRAPAMLLAPSVHGTTPVVTPPIVAAPSSASVFGGWLGSFARARFASTRIAARGPPRRLPPGGASSFWDLPPALRRRCWPLNALPSPCRTLLLCRKSAGSRIPRE
jgi:hypothetical protein